MIVMDRDEAMDLAWSLVWCALLGALVVVFLALTSCAGYQWQPSVGVLGKDADGNYGPWGAAVAIFVVMGTLYWRERRKTAAPE